jgi:hypothetical protein
VLRYGIPLLALVVAVFQLFQARNNDQVAWEGGGFGMFATVDAAENRRIATSPAVVLQDSATLQRALAHPGGLDSLASQIADGIDASVTVELSRVVYDDLVVAYQRIASATASP